MGLHRARAVGHLMASGRGLFRKGDLPPVGIMARYILRTSGVVPIVATYLCPGPEESSYSVDKDVGTPIILL